MNPFAQQVLAWFDEHGRTDLPWQQERTPYRVWVSEIMLQQTQVTTVIPYFERFMHSFPNVQALAQAEQDEVLHLWSGLGYYARGRNLHRAAQQLWDKWQGVFPDEVEQLQSLPGVGRSTAGAIVSLAMQRRAVILDGNVKRVLARHHRVAGWPGQSSVAKTLWELAERYTPEEKVADYNQAMMDLGATLCTRSRPRCEACPVAQTCQAGQQGDWRNFPGKKASSQKPVRQVQMLLIRNPQGELWLQARPSQGVWGGLWSFPELAMEENPLHWCEQYWPGQASLGGELPMRRHTFSHFHLDIHPREILLKGSLERVLEGSSAVWYNPRLPDQRGLAAPVARLIDEMNN